MSSAHRSILVIGITALTAFALPRAHADGRVVVEVTLGVWGDPHVDEKVRLVLSRPAANVDEGKQLSAELVARTAGSLRAVRTAVEALSSANLAEVGDDEELQVDARLALVRSLRRVARLGARQSGWSVAPLAPVVGAILGSDAEIGGPLGTRGDLAVDLAVGFESANGTFVSFPRTFVGHLDGADL